MVTGEKFAHYRIFEFCGDHRNTSFRHLVHHRQRTEKDQLTLQPHC
uniref:Uncharacterized protein n=1 Tax=Anguilla anguilla TaxID=7936 RepID=A0A0E9RKK3_ANGAN